MAIMETATRQGGSLRRLFQNPSERKIRAKTLCLILIPLVCLAWPPLQSLVSRATIETSEFVADVVFIFSVLTARAKTATPSRQREPLLRHLSLAYAASWPLFRALILPAYDVITYAIFAGLLFVSSSCLGRAGDDDPRQRMSRRPYEDECDLALLSTFSFLTEQALRHILPDSVSAGGAYYRAHARICAVIMGRDSDDPWDQLGAVSGDVDAERLDDLFHQHWLLNSIISGVEELSPAQSEGLGIDLGGGARSAVAADLAFGFVPTNEVLLSEIWYAEDRMKSWSDKVRVLAEAHRGLRLAPLPMLRRDGFLLGCEHPAAIVVDCQCCYAEFPIEAMVPCRDNGHLFCPSCVRRYAEERVFGVGSFIQNPVGQEVGPEHQNSLGANSSSEYEMKGSQPLALELTCMHGDGCNSGFNYEKLCRALPLKVLRQYDRLRATVDLSSAGVSDLCTCPQCELQAILPPTEQIFRCPECHFHSCRQCGNKAHGSLQCSDLDQVRTHCRTRVEEAMTGAYVRTCPRARCGRSFVKSSGCNKMKCPSCGTLTCYVCRAQIPKAVGYAHFCRAPHCRHESCGLCPLFSSQEDDDAIAIADARTRAEAEVEKERQDLEQQGNFLRRPISSGSVSADASGGLQKAAFRLFSKRKKKKDAMFVFQGMEENELT